MRVKTRDLILVAMFTALTTIGAFIKIPIGPVPITLQFMSTALAGMLLGSKLGALSQLIYIILGLIGIPVFTDGGGVSYVFKPSFGYLIGFMLASYIIGKLSENIEKASFIRLFFASIVGVAVIYIIGVPYLYLILKYVMGSKITMVGAVKTGFIIFLPGDIAKSIITALLGLKIVPAIRKSALV